MKKLHDKGNKPENRPEKPLSVYFKEVREKAGISQEAFADRIGKSREMYRLYEAGKYDDTTGDARRMKVIKAVRDYERELDREKEHLDGRTFAQEGDVGKRITELEAQVQDLQKLLNKILIKTGLT